MISIVIGRLKLTKHNYMELRVYFIELSKEDYSLMYFSLVWLEKVKEILNKFINKYPC